MPKIKIDMAVDGNMVDGVIENIAPAAKTGNIGESKTYVYGLGQVVRIRAGETGPNAL